MTLSELRLLFRLRTRDTKLPYIFSSAEIDANLNEAQREACIRAGLIEDETTTLAIDTTHKTYVLNPLIIDVLGLQTGTPLREFTSGWTLTESSLVLEVFPTMGATLTLHSIRLPTTSMIADSDTPQIRSMYHYALTDWAMSLCYLAPDTETFDQAAADRYAASFTKIFGERPSAQTMRERRRKPAKVVAYSGT